MITHQFNYKLKLNPASKKPSLTLPDQTMSLRTILERYARGLPITQVSTLDDADDEDADYHEFQKMDKIERIEYVRDFQEYVKRIRHEASEKERLQKLAEGNQKEQVGRKAPLSSTDVPSDPSSLRDGEGASGNENFAPRQRSGQTNSSEERGHK